MIEGSSHCRKASSRILGFIQFSGICINWPCYQGSIKVISVKLSLVYFHCMLSSFLPQGLYIYSSPRKFCPLCPYPYLTLVHPTSFHLSVHSTRNSLLSNPPPLSRDSPLWSHDTLCLYFVAFIAVVIKQWCIRVFASYVSLPLNNKHHENRNCVCLVHCYIPRN